ncbi:hypothetical protein CBS101457_004856 [Exobasidium rhododendri]|nr:hypothetical protein CBS101457_004856 [Exobasidium rhododendri]
MATYLVTGATRGIGAEIVKQLASVEENTIIAGVRDPSSQAAKDLLELSEHLIVVKIDSHSDTDAYEAAKHLHSQGIDHIDVIVANAGMASDWKSARGVLAKDFLEVLNVNVIGSLHLFQAFAPLLDRSSSPKILFVSSAIASMGIQRSMPYLSSSYGTSKAAINFLSLRIALENSSIVSLSLHPGLVQTEMAAGAQLSLGKTIEGAVSEGAAISPAASAKGIIQLAHDARLDTHSGRFFNATDGSELPW